jgi:hypothetical protein
MPRCSAALTGCPARDADRSFIEISLVRLWLKGDAIGHASERQACPGEQAGCGDKKPIKEECVFDRITGPPLTP